jgi:hypothetical protein
MWGVEKGTLLLNLIPAKASCTYITIMDFNLIPAKLEAEASPFGEFEDLGAGPGALKPWTSLTPDPQVGLPPDGGQTLTSLQ